MSRVSRGSKGVATAAGERESCGLRVALGPASAGLGPRGDAHGLYRNVPVGGHGPQGLRRSRCGSAHRRLAAPNQGTALATRRTRALRSATTTSTPAGLPGGGRLLPSAGGSTAGRAPPPAGALAGPAAPRGSLNAASPNRWGRAPPHPPPSHARSAADWGTRNGVPHALGKRCGARRWGRAAGGRRCTVGPPWGRAPGRLSTRGVRSGAGSPPVGAAAGSPRWGCPGRRRLPTRRTRCAPGTGWGTFPAHERGPAPD